MPRALVLALALIPATAGCEITGPAANRTAAAFQSASQSINNGVNSVAEIVAILRELSGKLDDRTYKAQVESLIGQLTQDSGVVAKESVDFVGCRVQESLAATLAQVLNRPAPPRVPYLTLPRTTTIRPGAPEPLTVSGWNLDVAAADPSAFRVVVRSPASGDRDVDGRLVRYQGQYLLTVDLTRVELRATDEALSFVGFAMPMDVPIEKPAPPASKALVIRPLYLDVYNKGHHKDMWACTLNVAVNGTVRAVSTWTRTNLTDDAEEGNLGPDNRDKKYTRYPLNTEPAAVVTVLPTDVVTVSATARALLTDKPRAVAERKLANAEKWAKHGVDQSSREAYRRMADDYRRTLEEEEATSRAQPLIAAENWGISRGQNESSHILGTEFRADAKPSEQPSFSLAFRVDESAAP